MNRVEEGIANFRDFQADARAFFTRSDTRDEERKDHQNQRDKEIKDTLTASNRRFTKYVVLIGLVPAIIEVLRLLKIIHYP